MLILNESCKILYAFHWFLQVWLKSTSVIIERCLLWLYYIDIQVIYMINLVINRVVLDELRCKTCTNL